MLSRARVAEVAMAINDAKGAYEDAARVPQVCRVGSMRIPAEPAGCYKALGAHAETFGKCDPMRLLGCDRSRRSSRRAGWQRWGSTPSSARAGRARGPAAT